MEGVWAVGRQQCSQAYSMLLFASGSLLLCALGGRLSCFALPSVCEVWDLGRLGCQSGLWHRCQASCIDCPWANEHGETGRAASLSAAGRCLKVNHWLKLPGAEQD